MTTIRTACTLQPNALEINVGDQIEKLDEVIQETDGRAYFQKTHITEGMETLLRKGVSRLAAKSDDAVFHLKQAMGGGKTHLMVGFGLLAKDAQLREECISHVPNQNQFGVAKVAAFNGRNNPNSFFWGEIARQLDGEHLFHKYWSDGPKAPDENDWIELFSGDIPILILLDEMPPYFHYYSTQISGTGTVADIVTRAFSNMLTAAQKKRNVCIVVSDLEAAYETGGNLIQRALDDATQEVGRAEISITPVNLESNEIYEILRKRLFASIPSDEKIADLTEIFAQRLSEAARAKSIERSAESLAQEISETYPFHPSFKNIVALFKDNEKFRQTRGLMELVSRLLKSVWEADEDVYLIGAQHFDLNILEVREKLADISEMRSVISKDLWDSNFGAHAQIIDNNAGNTCAKQVSTLLLTASLSTSVNAVKGLRETELLSYLIDPVNKTADFKNALDNLNKTAWYLHRSEEGKLYFDRVENLTKKLQSYAEQAPPNKIDDLVRHRLQEMYSPRTKEAYEKMLALPEMDEASAVIKTQRTLLIISPDGKQPPEQVNRFYEQLSNKNNLIVLTGEKTSIASIEDAARHVYAAQKASQELPESHPQRKELEEKQSQYEQDFQTTILGVFDKILFPRFSSGQAYLQPKVLDATYPQDEPYNGERQIIKTLTSDPGIKLYTNIPDNFDVLCARAETLLFGNQDDVRKADLMDKMRQNVQMPWMPTKGLDTLIQEAAKRGKWEELGDGYVTKKPKPKTTQITIANQSDPNDEGAVHISLEVVNGGATPRIHYAENGEVTEESAVVNGNTLETKALRVQFLAVDPNGQYETGNAYKWENQLVIRNRFEPSQRNVELFVAPCGSIRFSTDGSEPRNGTPYDGSPISIGDDAVTMAVFAECEGLETKQQFSFPASGIEELIIDPVKPVHLPLHSSLKRLDNSAKVFEALNFGKEKEVTFKQITIQIGSHPNSIVLTFGDIELKASFIEEAIQPLQSCFPPSVPIQMRFKQADFKTGHNFEKFLAKTGIEIDPSEVIQE